jgi:hypothetical protein
LPHARNRDEFSKAWIIGEALPLDARGHRACEMFHASWARHGLSVDDRLEKLIETCEAANTIELGYDGDLSKSPGSQCDSEMLLNPGYEVLVCDLLDEPMNPGGWFSDRIDGSW